MKKSSCIFFHNANAINLNGRSKLRKFIYNEIVQTGKSIQEIHVSFCDNNKMEQMNQKHLKHQGTTDVITFFYEKNPLWAEIFVGFEEVKDNAKRYKTSIQKETRRVIFHAVLHTIGFDDKTKQQKKEMTQQEDEWLKREGTTSHNP